MQAIRTHRLPSVTNLRIKATAAAGSVSIPWDTDKSDDDNHQAAAQALCVKVGWTTRRGAHGVLPDGSHVWIPVDRTAQLRNMLPNGAGEGL